MILDHRKYELFGKIAFEKVILVPPASKPYPMDNEACFLYVMEGEMESFSAIDRAGCRAEESLLMKCGNYLSRMIPTNTSGNYQAFAVHFHPDVLKKVYGNDLPGFLKQPGAASTTTSMVKIKGEELLARYIDSFLFYFENPELVTEDLLILKLKEIILLLHKTSNATAIREILSGLFSPTAYSFKQIVEAHLYSDLSLAEFAELNNMSLSSFKREFKKHYGESPAGYIRLRKLEQAARLLTLSDKRISDIAFDCGFNDLAHFSKIFQENYGEAPSRYRRSHNDKSLG